MHRDGVLRRRRLHGLSVTVPRALFVASGSVKVEVCDAGGCATSTAALRPAPEGPVGRQVDVSFSDLGRSFGPGPVDVEVELSDAGRRVVAAADRATTLARSFPNGGPCDGDGYVVGVVDLTAGDRV